MKPIVKWQANDGTVFDHEQECIDYEQVNVLEATLAEVRSMLRCHNLEGSKDAFVYIFVKDNVCIYVGRTNQIQARLASHNIFRGIDTTNIIVRLLLCPDTATARHIEHYFIRALKPTLNKNTTASIDLS